MRRAGGIKTDAGKDRIIPIHPLIQPYVIGWYNKSGSYLIERNKEAVRDNYYRKFGPLSINSTTEIDKIPLN